ncbi:MAG: IS1595 family transposase [bacterium]|nr:IS1595 family transposase [bacterium]
MHRDLGIGQKAAWFMQQRIREAFVEERTSVFSWPVEVDETYVGRLQKNKHGKDKLNVGRGAVGKTDVAGVKDRETSMVVAEVVQQTNKQTLQGFVRSLTASGAAVYTDEAKAYNGLANHQSVRHSSAEYVIGNVHTNGMESFVVHAQAGVQGHVPQDQPEAHAPICR